MLNLKIYLFLSKINQHLTKNGFKQKHKKVLLRFFLLNIQIYIYIKPER